MLDSAIETFALPPILNMLCCRERRRDEIVSIQQQIGEQFAEGLVGKEIEVLVDGYNDDGQLFGRTQVSNSRGGQQD